MPIRKSLNRATTAFALIAALMVVASCGEAPKRKKYAYYDGAKSPNSRYETVAATGGQWADGDFGPSNGLEGAKGTIKGIFKFAGKVRPVRVIDVGKDKWCKKNHAGKVKTESLIVDASGRVKDVFCYISKGMNEQKHAEPGAAQLIQDGCFYTPHVLGCQVGQKLEIINRDNTSHNFHFFGFENKSVNQTQSGPRTDTHRFEKPEVGATFKCDFHPWMLCNVHVLPHPYFVVSEVDGTFELKNVPAGKYQIAFQHERLQLAPMEVTVTADGTCDLGELALAQ